MKDLNKDYTKYVFVIIGVLLIIVLLGCRLKPMACGFEPAKNVALGNATSSTLNASQEVGVTAENTTQLAENPVSPKAQETSLDLTTEEKALPLKVVTEGELVSFPKLKAYDPDGDKITYTFTAPLNSKGEWQTLKGDAGKYRVTVTASDRKNQASQDIIILVKQANNLPEIAAKDITADEGKTAVLDFVVSDKDNDKVDVEISGWMNSKQYTTNFDDAGEHKVIITASDGKDTVTKEVTVTVLNVNRAPKLGTVEDITLKETEKAVIKPKAQDPDGDEVAYTFSKPFDSQGEWQTKLDDAGEYKIKVVASDGNLSDDKIVLVTVNAINRPPVIEIAPELTVNEGETVVLNFTVSDYEEESVDVKISGWMNSKEYTTNFDDAGEHKVIITASDSENTVNKTVIVNVKNTNRPPAFGADSFD